MAPIQGQTIFLPFSLIEDSNKLAINSRFYYLHFIYSENLNYNTFTNHYKYILNDRMCYRDKESESSKHVHLAVNKD